MSARRVFVALLATVALAVAFAPTADAQCNYPPLVSGSSVYYPNGTTNYPYISMNTPYWTAVGLRPDAGSDWDIAMYSGTSAFPTCVNGLLTNSVAGGSAVDFVVGDFNHNANGNYIARPYLFSGLGGATVEWDDGSDIMGINAPWTFRTTGPSDVLEMWDVFFEQSKYYYIILNNPSNAHLRLLVFQSSTATYWGNRGTANYQSPVVDPNSVISVQYQSNANDWFGLLVVNEDGGSGNYQVAVQTCTPPAPLTSGTSQVAFNSVDRFSFTQSIQHFAAIGVRADNPSDDWWIGTFAGPFDVTYGNCFQGSLASSIINPGRVEYVVGDFNPGGNPLGTYFADALPILQYQGSAHVEWDDGPDDIVVGAAPITVPTDVSDVLTCWDVDLTAGTPYHVHFAPSGSAVVKLGLYKSAGAPYWVSRPGALIGEQPGDFDFVAPTSDRYGIVVANENGQSGSYELGINSLIGVEPSAAQVTHIDRVVPNPMSQACQIRYSLAASGEVRFDVVNVAGRLVAELNEGVHGEGLSSATWTGRDADGRALAAGVYYLRMRVDGRFVEDTRLVVLPP